MSDELMPFDLPIEKKSIIKVLGVGGGGGNAVNHMFKAGIKDVNFVICNTDAQALETSPIPTKLQLGGTLTGGLGAGNQPDNGRQAAIENLENVVEILNDGTKMAFITAGMGGGTGTGAAPVIAQAAKELGILTVAIVTIPFKFEGQRRIDQAIDGISELSAHVDSLLVINNEKLREVHGDLTLSNAFAKADDVLTVAAKGIAEIITVPGYVNVDFADVRTVMSNSGVAIMGSGYGEGENRALDAVKEALNSPLLNSNDIRGAKNILLNVISGTTEVTMDEIGTINDFVQEASGNTADLIWGNTIDLDLGEKIAVTVIATGFKTDIIPELLQKKEQYKTIHQLESNSKKVVKVDDVPFEIERKKNYSDYEENYDVELEDEYELEDENENNFSLENNSVELDYSLDETEYELEIEEKYEIKEKTKTEENEEINKEDETVNKMLQLKDKIENSKKTTLNSSDYKNIEDLENIPAFRRKQLDIELENHSSSNKISKYSLFEDEEDNQKIKKNSYLHDKVD